MVFSPHTARKLAEQSLKKVRDARAATEVKRQSAQNNSKSYRASTTSTPNNNSNKLKVGSIRDESSRLRQKGNNPNWRTAETDQLLDHTVTRRDGSMFNSRQMSVNPVAGRRLTDKIKKRQVKKLEREKRDRWESQDLFQMPLSKVTKKSSGDGPLGMQSIFEKMQESVEITKSLNMGATKSDKTRLSRNALKAMGEESYDGTVAKRWTGVGLGIGGAGALGGGLMGGKEKRRPGTPDYGSYFN
tara:strand:- start:148 stop:879 length:732 start_codon:yes stop_codon:yes gene_type:complete